MRQPLRELAFQPVDAADESFAIGLARHAFGAWSRDAGGTVFAMLHAPGRLSEIAASGGERLGFYVVSTRRLGRPFGPIDDPVVAHLDAIAVHPRAEGRGVGAALLVRAERRARSLGAVVMSLTTAVGNQRAQHLFARHGFLRTMKTASAYANDEDAYEMFKPL